MNQMLVLAADVLAKVTPPAPVTPAAPTKAAGALTKLNTVPTDNHNTGWVLGFVFFGVVVAAVVALLVPILLLANKIGKQAPDINASLQRSLDNTAGLAGLETTIDHATEIISGLNRARVRLGG